MRIQCDTLKYATLLKQNGLNSNAAEGLMTIVSDLEIFNLYSKSEVNSMLAESIEKIFVKQDLKLIEQRREREKELVRLETELQKDLAEFETELQKDLAKLENELQKDLAKLENELQKDLAKEELKLAEQRREFDARLQEQLKEQREEFRSYRRWMVGTIISVGLSLAAYLSALIHFNH